MLYIEVWLDDSKVAVKLGLQRIHTPFFWNKIFSHYGASKVVNLPIAVGGMLHLWSELYGVEDQSDL